MGGQQSLAPVLEQPVRRGEGLWVVWARGPVRWIGLVAARRARSPQGWAGLQALAQQAGAQPFIQLQGIEILQA